MHCLALIDFGSTFTKVALVNLDSEQLIARHQAPSTVNDGIMDGLNDAIGLFSSRERQLLYDAKKYACSSAGGGLRIVAIGLVPTLTVEAARRAALGAGGKIISSYGYELTETDMEEISNQSADLILLAGGTDGGNTETILNNVEKLTALKKDIPYIIAGNRVANGKAAEILRSAGLDAMVTENILPSLDELNVEPARQLIRDVFMTQIVKAKGIDGAQQFVGNIIMPTPMATLEGGKLIASGTGGLTGLGELMIVEVGGATTNIHSVGSGYPTRSKFMVKGLPEPYAKRTVEGDLGIRYNAQTIVDRVGQKLIYNNMPNRSAMPDKAELGPRINNLVKNTCFLPLDDLDHMLDASLAYSAVHLATERHCGTIKEVPTMNGMAYLLHGKDLTNIKIVIGAGGVFANGKHPGEILNATVFDNINPTSLRPVCPNFLIDKEYLLYGIGLISKDYPEQALNIGKKYLKALFP